MHINKKTFIITLTFLMAVCFYIDAFAAQAPTANVTSEERVNTFAQESGLSVTSHTTIIQNTLNALLTLLALIFLILIIYSGFMWMTSAGNEEKVKKAKSTLKNATIGVIIVLFSFVITQFVFSAINHASTPPETSGSGDIIDP